MAFHIRRKLSATKPTALIDEIKHRMYAHWNEQFRRRVDAISKPANCQSKPFGCSGANHRVTQFVSRGESFGSYD